MARKRVTIVFEETDATSLAEGASNQGFQVFIEGAEGTKTKPEIAWTAAEFWGLKCFAIVVDVMKRSGAFDREIRKGGS